MRLSILVCAVVLAIVSFSTNSAQGGVEFGIQGDYNKFRDTEGSDFGLGARLRFGSGLGLTTSFDYFFVDDQIGDAKFYEFCGNLDYTFPTYQVRPYLGAGLSVSRFTLDFTDNFLDDSQTELGANILGGLKFGAGSVQPFGEIRYVIYSGDETFKNRFVLSAGLLF